MGVKSLREVIEINSSFKTAVNLYLSLNKTDKVLSYIPTKSSIRFMDEYLEAILGRRDHATLLVGPYGKGKSHLLLVLLAILSMERNKENAKIVRQLKSKIKSVEDIGEKVAEDIEKIWNSNRFLPVIINDTRGDLNRAFWVALGEALKRNNLNSLIPDTYYSEALKRIDEWERDYPETYAEFISALAQYGYDIKGIRASLKQFENGALETFRNIYPSITAGSSFNPLTVSEVLPLYKSVSEKLVEDFDYAGIFVVFDEFSKFIEGLEGTNAGNTMKLLQDMCELANESANSQIYLTMVAHKSIKEYGKYLSTDIINAFTGIEGRIQERFFVTSSKNNYELIRNAIIKKKDGLEGISEIKRYLDRECVNEYYQLPIFRRSFSEDDFYNIILRGCYPLNPLAAYLLLNISEKVAQNERTLFTFISNDEPYSLARFVEEHEASKGWLIGADRIYDYFSGLFKKEVSNELVHGIWLGAEYAISKCTNEEEVKFIKTLALINIVNKGEECPASEKYLSLAGLLIDVNTTVSELAEKQLIYKKSSIGAFVFKTRAGSELKAEIKKQRELKGDNCNYSKAMQLITAKYFVIPRKYNAEKMMTRYFSHEYMNVAAFLSISNAETIFDENDNADGKVISLYCLDKCDLSAVKGHFKELKCNKLVIVLPCKPVTALKELRDYEILQEIRKNQIFIDSNPVLKKEIPLLEEDLVKAVEDELGSLYSAEDTQVMYWSKGKMVLEGAAFEENAVNISCYEVYNCTPIINNEIINRATITTAQTKKARINIIDAILNGRDDEDFYSGTNQEATIYRALFGKSEIGSFDMDHNLEKILALLDEFVTSCSDQKVSLSNVISLLRNAPYGVRMGVLPIYLAKVLSQRNEDLIVYYVNMEVQITPEIIVNMCENADEHCLFVSKSDILKEEYIRGLNTLFDVNNGRALSENRIKNIVMCMQRWYRALPQVTRNLAVMGIYDGNQRLTSNMKSMRNMLQKVDINPYELLFVTIPQEFATEDLQEALTLIKGCKEAFDSHLSKVINNVVETIYEIWGGKKKRDLYQMLKEWYERQSSLSKQGLHSGGVTNLMSCIERLDVYGDEEIAQKIVKAVTNVYVENWIDNATEEFSVTLSEIKKQVESLKTDNEEGKLLLSFVGSHGEKIERFYERADEGKGTILRNIIEDTLDEYDDLSVNDRVAILLEMIERIIG